MKPPEIRDLEWKYGRLRRGRSDHYDLAIKLAAYVGLLICAVLIVAGATWRW